MKVNLLKRNHHPNLVEVAEILLANPCVAEVHIPTAPLSFRGPRGADSYKPDIYVQLMEDPETGKPVISRGLQEQGVNKGKFGIQLCDDDCSDADAQRLAAGMIAWFERNGYPVLLVTAHDWAVHAHRFA